MQCAAAYWTQSPTFKRSIDWITVSNIRINCAHNWHHWTFESFVSNVCVSYSSSSSFSCIIYFCIWFDIQHMSFTIWNIIWSSCAWVEEIVEWFIWHFSALGFGWLVQKKKIVAVQAYLHAKFIAQQLNSGKTNMEIFRLMHRMFFLFFRNLFVDDFIVRRSVYTYMHIQHSCLYFFFLHFFFIKWTFSICSPQKNEMKYPKKMHSRMRFINAECRTQNQAKYLWGLNFFVLQKRKLFGVKLCWNYPLFDSLSLSFSIHSVIWTLSSWTCTFFFRHNYWQ